MANIAKLEAVLGQIKAHPEQHNQKFWAKKTECGTSYCFAGWAVVLEGGYEIDLASRGPDGVKFAVTSSGRTRHICGIAKDILGLNMTDAMTLFHQANTVDDLERMVKNLANDLPILDGVDD